MRVVLTGGGSGGHVYPLIATARGIARRALNTDIVFVGSLSFGKEIMMKEGISVQNIIAGKFPRYITSRIFLELIKIPVGFFQALWKIYWLMPDVVFGKGGYGMVPVVIAAWLYRIPVIIHESDSIAGLSTKFAARFAKTILVSFPVTHGLSKSRMQVVGNPVRDSITRGDRARAQKRFNLALKNTVLVLGGSQGANELNELLIQIAPQLAAEAEVIHQVGVLNAERFAREVALTLEPYPDASRFYHIVSFLDEEMLADAYAAATVVVSRAGAGAIFELALLGLPTIFLPLKNSAGGHQHRNAEIVFSLGAAHMLSGANLTPHLLLDDIQTLLKDDARRSAMSERFRAFAKPNAAAEIASIIVNLANSK